MFAELYVCVSLEGFFFYSARMCCGLVDFLEGEGWKREGLFRRGGVL